VSKERKLWRAKDLYIDFIVKGDGRYYVVDIDEFNDAISRKELQENDVKDALNGLDNILKGYYENNDLDNYLDSLRKQYGGIGELIISKKTA
jgi:predicted RNA-binding protein associated with RNAse of E/G family